MPEDKAGPDYSSCPTLPDEFSLVFDHYAPATESERVPEAVALATFNQSQSHLNS